MASLRSIAAQFPLSWSHYALLVSRARSPEALEFYHTEALRGGWSVRQLQRQIDSQFYERTALSRNKSKMLAGGSKAQPGDVLSADEEVKDPLVLEFLGLKDEYSESDLEEALIRHLEHFHWNWATTLPSSPASAACGSTTSGIALTCCSFTGGCGAWW